MKIGSNIQSLLAQRGLTQSSNKLSSVYERLSSGMRINRASDDAAGLAIADSLRSDSKIYSQAIKNANDGLSMLAIAESAVQELSSVMTRISELAEQAANGIYSSSQRQALDNEAQALKAEFSRIMESTTFNNQNLLNGDIGNLVLQVGANSEEESRIEMEFTGLLTHATWDGTFSSTATPTTTGRVEEVLAEDLNNDGYDDIVFTGNNGSALSYALSNGDGTFQATTQIAGVSHNTIGMGDFNEDGYIDLIAQRFDSTRIFLNNGAGFSVSTQIGNSFDFGDFPTLVADINGDNHLDYAQVSTSQDKLQVFIGNGNGTFQAQQEFVPGGDIEAGRFADLNNDGRQDLYLNQAGSEAVLLGNGDGTFGPASAMATIAGAEIELGDVNNDGVIDLVSASAFSNARVSLGNGDGTFQAQVTVTSTSLNALLSLFDVNQDGTLDIVRQSSGPGLLNINIGNGDGTFQSDLTFATGQSSRSLAAFGDFNSDGVWDVALPGYDASQVAILMAGTLSGSGISEFSLLTRAEALEALDYSKESIAQLSSQLGKIGATQGRLNVAIGNLLMQRENALAAESRIRDADIALESSELVRQQLLQQVGAAILAQANTNPALVLTLLQGGS